MAEENSRIGRFGGQTSGAFAPRVSSLTTRRAAIVKSGAGPGFPAIWLESTSRTADTGYRCPGTLEQDLENGGDILSILAVLDTGLARADAEPVPHRLRHTGLLHTPLLHMGAVVLLVLASGPSSSAQGACDRDCLRGFITQYLDALIAHKPAALPVTADIRFTEDTVPMKLGEGLWKTASRLRPYRQEFIDVRAGVAGAHVVVEEGTSPSMVVLRLRIVGRRIAEAETMVVRNRAEGVLFEPEALKAPSPAMTLVPPAAQRNTRDEAIRIAQLYPAGLRAGSFVKVDTPFATGAYRFENGRMMAGPGCTFAAGCDNIKTQGIPTLSEATSRLAAVDEELNIVYVSTSAPARSARPGRPSSLCGRRSRSMAARFTPSRRSWNRRRWMPDLAGSRPAPCRVG